MKPAGFAYRSLTRTFAVGRDPGPDAMLLEIIPRRHPGEEPPPRVAEAMTRAAVVGCPTRCSLNPYPGPP